MLVDILQKSVLSDYGELLNKTFSLIDEEQFLRVSRMLDKAKRVYIYGIGSSGLVAREMEFRFMRLGMICKAITDDHMIRVNEVMLDDECLVIGISLSGETKEILDAVYQAKQKGSRTVLITSKISAFLKGRCDELVSVAVKESLPQRYAYITTIPSLSCSRYFYAYYVDLDREREGIIYSLIHFRPLNLHKTEDEQ